MRNDRLLLQDILEAIKEVAEATPPTEAEFHANKFARSHVLRHIQIIGEATWRLSDSLKSQNPDVPWRQIAGMRHVLVHDYFVVNWSRVYETAHRDVPALRAPIEAMLASIAPDADSSGGA
jgi:uncharacterized protein with HEPN domain